MSSLPLSIRTALASAGFLVLGGCSMAEPTLQETLEFELAVNPDSVLLIDAGAGPLTVEGDSGDSIRVEAGIYQTSANDDYRVVLEADGENAARIIAEAASSSFGTSDYIDLSVRVPRSIELQVDDGSGSIRIRNVDGHVDIEDQSGSLEVSNVGGHLTIDDGSGSIAVDGVGGDVTIEDGSGSIEVSNVGGTVSVDDGSGSISVSDAGDFELIDDGSGSVRLNNIRSRGDAG